MFKIMGAIFIAIGFLLNFLPRLIWMKKSQEEPSKRSKESENFDSALVTGRFLGIILIVIGVVLIY